MVKYCPRCGTPNSDDANFCGRCGYQFPTMSPPPQPYPPYQPQYPMPYQQPYPLPQKKKFPIKAVIGAVVAVVVVLTVFFVVLPLLSPKYTLADAPKVAESYYGGNWYVDSSKTATASYVGHGEYSVTFQNGTTVTMNIYQLQNYISTELSLIGLTSSGNLNGMLFYPKYQPSFVEYKPTKIYIEVLNESGTDISIALLGAYWNYTPNTACIDYNKLTPILTNATIERQISLASSLASQYGIYFNLYNSGNYDYDVISISNTTFMQQFIDPTLGVNWKSMGAIAGLSTNIIAVAIVINQAPTPAQLNTFLNMIINNL